MLFPVWLLIGALIYAAYGYHKNRKVEKIKLNEIEVAEEKEEEEKINEEQPIIT